MWAKLAHFPVWPATIDLCTTGPACGQHYRKPTAKCPAKYWCSFTAETVGNWVSVKSISPYDPSLAQQYITPSAHHYHEAQLNAISISDEDFYKMNKTKSMSRSASAANPTSPVPSAPASSTDAIRTSARQKKRQQSATPEPASQPPSKKRRPQRPQPPRSPQSPSEEEGTLPASPASPRASRRKATPRVSAISKSVVKPKRSSAKRSASKPTAAQRNTTLEGELAEANATIKQLRKEISKKRRELSEAKPPTSVSIHVPEGPMDDDTSADTPPDCTHGTKAMTPEAFTSTMEKLNHSFANLKRLNKAAIEGRAALVNEADEATKSLQESFAVVAKDEQAAITAEETMNQILRTLIISRIEMEDLRSQQAGKIVVKIGKMCKELPAVRSLTHALTRNWRRQCISTMEDGGEAASPTGSSSPVAKGKGASGAIETNSSAVDSVNAGFESKGAATDAESEESAHAIDSTKIPKTAKVVVRASKAADSAAVVKSGSEGVAGAYETEAKAKETTDSLDDIKSGSGKGTVGDKTGAEVKNSENAETSKGDKVGSENGPIDGETCVEPKRAAIAETAKADKGGGEEATTDVLAKAEVKNDVDSGGGKGDAEEATDVCHSKDLNDTGDQNSGGILAAKEGVETENVSPLSGNMPGAQAGGSVNEMPGNVASDRNVSDKTLEEFAVSDDHKDKSSAKIAGNLAGPTVDDARATEV